MAELDAEAKLTGARNKYESQGIGKAKAIL